MPMYSTSDWERPFGEVERTSAWRPPITRDWGRIIHSAAFRRLQGKTQVFPGHESDFFRNRLTHSLEVAQIAEGIACRLNAESLGLQGQPINERLCAAAALIHDIGHPPFGHNGERALDDAMKRFGGFEGNAQTLRIVTALERKVRDGEFCHGLNLTNRLLAAVLKYDNEIKQKRKQRQPFEKGYYHTESDLVARVKDAVAPGFAGGKFKTVECQIMDIADDIAYSTFDLEDSFKAGFVTPASILASSEDLLDRVAKKVSKTLNKNTEIGDVFLAFSTLFESIGEATRSEFPLLDFRQMATASSALANDSYLRTAFSSQLVGKAIAGVSIVVDKDFPMLSEVKLDEESALRVEILKHYTYEATVTSSRVKTAEYRGYEVVQRIFEALTAKNGRHLLPEDVRCKLDIADSKSGRRRVICDYIAGMTDRFAVEFYGRLHSDSAQSMFKPF